jgi:signal transduction histidine kinase
VGELSAALERNAKLDARVRGAAARATAVNERLLRRISADLHDGPGQDLGFALMRLEAMVGDRPCPAPSADAPGSRTEDVRAVRTSVESALAELRAVSAGLQLPDIEGLSVAEIAARAVRDYERKTGVKAGLQISGGPTDVAQPVKITLYRLLQESLANGFRHAGGIDQHVSLRQAGDRLTVTIRDGGPGFDGHEALARDRVGLAAMRERVAALGGSFELDAEPGRGTIVRATMPTHVPELDDE